MSVGGNCPAAEMSGGGVQGEMSGSRNITHFTVYNTHLYSSGKGNGRKIDVTSYWATRVLKKFSSSAAV